jgi:cytochrome c-type biogenesis protein CcmH
MRNVQRLLLSACLLIAGPVLALIETYEFSTPDLEARYHQMSQELRCPKCQNQNIADSDAPIAQDLRKLLHQQLEQGASDEEILEHMVARYGEFVRYRPRFGGATLALWLAPVLLLLAAIGAVIAMLRSRRSGARETSVPLDTQEQARLQALLEKAGRDS